MQRTVIKCYVELRRSFGQRERERERDPRLLSLQPQRAPPPFGQYGIILLRIRRTCAWTTCPCRVVPKRPGVEPATSDCMSNVIAITTRVIMDYDNESRKISMTVSRRSVVSESYRIIATAAKQAQAPTTSWRRSHYSQLAIKPTRRACKRLHRCYRRDTKKRLATTYQCSLYG